MPPEPAEKIKIEWDDLNTRKVDQRLREQDAVARNREQADRVPLVTSDTARRGSIWYNPVFTMAVFGLLGGLLAWGGREAFRLRPDLRAEADVHRHDLDDLDAKDRETDRRRADQQAAFADTKGLPPAAAEKAKLSEADLDRQAAAEKHDTDLARRELVSEYSDNPYFKVYSDTTLSPDQKTAAVADLRRQDAPKDFLANLLSFGITGLLVGLCLSIADPVVDRNRSAALVNGLIGATLGLIGGAVASFLMPKVFAAVAATGVPHSQLFARSLSWGVLGLFLTLGPGLVLRNFKKLLIGGFGGLIGGLVGGAVFDPVYTASNGSDVLSWLTALLLIGLTAGAATGLIENAAKGGWLKVTAGLIAGKQFILYRNPTFIGSGPECPIYLFKDPKVGRRHAAIHVVPGGFEIENLPLGDPTLVNEKPVTRSRLKAGDQIGIGATRFVFQEKSKVGA